jgi:Arm DNA-binding domain/Phage integrase central domain
MPTVRRKITDTFIRSRKPGKPAERNHTMDAVHPRLGLRVTDTGHRSFFYLARFPGSTNPTRRSLGTYPVTTLEQARKKARHWDELLAEGIDPKDEEQRIRAEAERAYKAELEKQENTFAARAAEYLAGPVRMHRQAKEVARVVHKELSPIWGDRTLDTITSKDVKDLVIAIVDRGAPAMARNVLTICKSFFGWAEEREHIENSPAATAKPTRPNRGEKAAPADAQ